MNEEEAMQYFTNGLVLGIVLTFLLLALEEFLKNIEESNRGGL